MGVVFMLLFSAYAGPDPDPSPDADADADADVDDADAEDACGVADGGALPRPRSVFAALLLTPVLKGGRRE